METRFDAIHSKLVYYELAKDATYLLELALWKSKIDQSMQNINNDQMEDDAADLLREQCRINCGADIIIPNVLSYW